MRDRPSSQIDNAIARVFQRQSETTAASLRQQRIWDRQPKPTFYAGFDDSRHWAVQPGSAVRFPVPRIITNGAIARGTPSIPMQGATGIVLNQMPHRRPTRTIEEAIATGWLWQNYEGIATELANESDLFEIELDSSIVPELRRAIAYGVLGPNARISLSGSNLSFAGIVEVTEPSDIKITVTRTLDIEGYKEFKTEFLGNVLTPRDLPEVTVNVAQFENDVDTVRGAWPSSMQALLTSTAEAFRAEAPPNPGDPPASIPGPLYAPSFGVYQASLIELLNGRTRRGGWFDPPNTLFNALRDTFLYPLRFYSNQAGDSSALNLDASILSELWAQNDLFFGWAKIVPPDALIGISQASIQDDPSAVGSETVVGTIGGPVSQFPPSPLIHEVLINRFSTSSIEEPGTYLVTGAIRAFYPGVVELYDIIDGWFAQRDLAIFPCVSRIKIEVLPPQPRD